MDKRGWFGVLASAATFLSTSAIASAAPVSWAIPTTQIGSTTCRQDDGIPDYRTSLEGDAAGCRWTRSIAIPAWIVPRLTGFRGFVLTDVYAGSWTVSALAPDGTTPLGSKAISNFAGRSDTENLVAAQVLDASGRATLQMRGSAYSGLFANTYLSGFQVEFDDSQPPRLEDPSIRVAARADRLDSIPTPAFVVIDNGPSLSKVQIAWGDGKKDDVYTSIGAPWDGSENTRHPISVDPSPHYYDKQGLFRVTLTVVDGAGNTLTQDLGAVRVGPGPIAGADGTLPVVASISSIRRPSISGVARVGRTLTCARGTWKSSPTRFVYSWQRRTDGVWRTVGARARTRTLRPADAGRKVRCSVKASKAGQVKVATSPGRLVRSG